MSTTTAREHSLGDAISHAAHLLPAQGPIGVFIHHNTLHAFQHLRFEDAVVKAGAVFGAEPYMAETAYHREFRAGRIQAADLDRVLKDEPNAVILPGRLDRRTLRRRLLVPGPRPVDTASVGYLLEEGGWLERLRRDLDQISRAHLLAGSPNEAAAARFLHEACLMHLEEEARQQASPVRPRDAVWWQREIDLDEVIHPLLIRLSAVYLDQGMSYWPMPGREAGFYGAVRELLTRPGAIFPAALRLLGEEFGRQRSAGLNSEQALGQLLNRLGIEARDYTHYLEAELLALPGWAGLMRQLEENPGLAPHTRLVCSLTDFLAVRSTFTVAALAALDQDTRAWKNARMLRPAGLGRSLEAARLFDAAQLVGLGPAEVAQMPEEEFRLFRAEVAAAGEFERRRLWHLAYERRHELLILGPLGRYRLDHRPITPAADGPAPPAAQVFFCIDEREESIRRALEECDPGLETYGAAGFFGVAVDYQGIDDAHGVALCPVVVTPQHSVRERPRAGDEELHEQRISRRRHWAAVARALSVGSRTLLRGWISTAFLGALSLFPLLARVLSPLRFARLRAALNDRFLPEPRTELAFMRDDERGHEAVEGLARGFTVEEKATRVAGVLGAAGLTRQFAPLVVVLGHGSTSLNNPHESAHDCGACGGRRGGPNARLFAAMANHPGVREALRAKGIEIPKETWFIGGYHDTCSDDIDLFDTSALPARHTALFTRVRQSLDRARALSAHERARRFEAAEGAHTSADALLHVEERSEHLAEPRPEYGHCTNAVCIVGRRAVTRGLFMDRRAFLVSYDASVDPDDKYLAGLLGAVFPVCGGISLEYYFSFVDNERYGCGTKLPHNVTGLVGVMNGHAGDLRTGLPWQMVEIHEPVRILFVIETTPERLSRVVAANPTLVEFVENRWVRVATLDPFTGALHAYRGNGTYEPVAPGVEPLPKAKSSIEWYGGRMEHLPLAEITAA